MQKIKVKGTGTRFKKGVETNGRWVNIFSASSIGTKYCDERLCISVCPLAYLKNHMSKLRESFCRPIRYLVVVKSSSGSNATMLCTSGFVNDSLVSDGNRACAQSEIQKSFV